MTRTTPRASRRRGWMFRAVASAAAASWIAGGRPGAVGGASPFPLVPEKGRAFFGDERGGRTGAVGAAAASAPAAPFPVPPARGPPSPLDRPPSRPGPPRRPHRRLADLGALNSILSR